jgi:MoaA/NifB/PqqE/SkfB family radical SAM enzyme
MDGERARLRLRFRLWRRRSRGEARCLRRCHSRGKARRLRFCLRRWGQEVSFVPRRGGPKGRPFHPITNKEVSPMEYFAFQWHITDECDQRCKHCYIFSENTCKQLDSMSWDQMEETFYNCLDFCQVYHRLPYFYLTGGDPILHPDFWKLLELMKERDIPFTILGNPFHLTDEVCQRLKSLGCQKYQLSIDGMRETHDWFRKPGSFDLTLEKIGCLNRVRGQHRRGA